VDIFGASSLEEIKSKGPFTPVLL